MPGPELKRQRVGIPLRPTQPAAANGTEGGSAARFYGKGGAWSPKEDDAHASGDGGGDELPEGCEQARLEAARLSANMEAARHGSGNSQGQAVPLEEREHVSRFRCAMSTVLLFS